MAGPRHRAGAALISGAESRGHDPYLHAATPTEGSLAMRYNRYGRTGLFVSELCLGTMTFGGKGFFEYMGQVGQDDADGLVRAAIEQGVNFIDTANVYSEGLSEQITGQAIRNLGLKRQDLVISTKVLGPMGQGPNSRGASRVHILDQAKASLERLQTDYIDIYHVHGFDPATPIEESLRALDTLVQHGHVRYVAISNWAAWQVAKALGISERLGIARIEGMQSYYSLVGRELEREIVPLIQSEQLGLMAWSPLAGGYLSGKYRKGSGEGRRDARSFPPVNETRGEAVLDVLDRIASSHGTTPAEVALAWLLHQPFVSSVIMGAKRMDQLEANLRAAKLVLSAEDLEALDAASRIAPEYPGWMLAIQGAYRDNVLNQPARGA
jgi:aryl-alcohol dehydrogenase-like predicted oxidoreductase